MNRKRFMQLVMALAIGALIMHGAGSGMAQEAPECEGKVATIYVKDGIIVGGPDDGKPYKGVLMGYPWRRCDRGN
jgi:hypothetical protein